MSVKSSKFREAAKKMMFWTRQILNIMLERAWDLLLRTSCIALKANRLIAMFFSNKVETSLFMRGRAYLRRKSKIWLNLSKISTMEEMKNIWWLSLCLTVWAPREPLYLHILYFYSNLTYRKMRPWPYGEAETDWNTSCIYINSTFFQKSHTYHWII